MKETKNNYVVAHEASNSINNIKNDVLLFLEKHLVTLLILAAIILASYTVLPKSIETNNAMNNPVAATPSLPIMQPVQKSVPIMCVDSSSNRVESDGWLTDKTEYNSTYHSTICGWQQITEYVLVQR